MTLSDITTACRRRHNALGDNFYSDAELWQLIYEACVEYAREVKCIENTFTSTTVASTQSYAYPTNLIEIKRITYNGAKLEPINMREDDLLTLSNQSTTSTGTPQYYFVWDEAIYLRPIPDAAQTLKVFGPCEPSMITVSTATIEVPSVFHTKLINFVVSEMYAKDQNFQAATYYMNMFLTGLQKDKGFWKKRKRADALGRVMDEETSAATIIGAV